MDSLKDKEQKSELASRIILSSGTTDLLDQVPDHSFSWTPTRRVDRIRLILCTLRSHLHAFILIILPELYIGVPAIKICHRSHVKVY